MLKVAYEIGELLALEEAGLTKESGAISDTARVTWKALKGGAKNVGKSVRDAAAKLRAAKPAGVGDEFLKNYPGGVPAAVAAAREKVIPVLERNLLEQAKPWLVGGGIGLGAAGAGYAGYKGLQSLFPDADASRINHPIKALFGVDD